MLKGLQWPLWLPEAWYNKGCTHRLINSRKGCARTVISMSVYLSVCLSAKISPERDVWSLPIFVDVAYIRGTVVLQQGNKIPRKREGAHLEVFFPTDNALYSIAFGTHTKTAEPIEMPLGWWVGLVRGTVCYVRVTIPEGKGAIWGENICPKISPVRRLTVNFR